METTTESIAAYERAGRQVAREHGWGTAGVIYCGLVTGCLRQQELATGTAELQSEHLVEVLCGDRLGNAAANELGFVACLNLLAWLIGGWDHIAWRASEVTLREPDPDEQHHRRAAEESAVEAGARGASDVAVAVYAGVVAAARVRWHTGGDEWDDAHLVVAAVVAGDPAAEAAQAELDEGFRNGAAGWTNQHWGEIDRAAEDLAVLDQIAAAA
ncbi:Uncharacterised protein [Mycobacteroides abscessus subsp. abscessus]|uniref:hypothetical protein n=1 Tax=Mycobacteroides abscessus TaxID=36809 RepID=UPI0005DED692|nr:hypothetical protein [Mycobacteroides abscessus]ANO17373.1 hypothetical protein BAB78_01210 [Mycobacteroides abscessus]MDB2220987.1 hypothetical protein [Mycobacteroides abscessus subsp. abscessus]OTR08821.1 hypothetical protein B9M85_01150 [Mycobacteroides abscessus]CPR89844.1 Uncharacterised protein [Mycobacteroides abscessus]SHS87363.1 Uncharacterised protein [Mycobacteroides abscessus subsp. abscessus]